MTHHPQRIADDIGFLLNAPQVLGWHFGVAMALASISIISVGVLFVLAVIGANSQEPRL